MEPAAQRVVIGMDPHKRSVTIEVMTADETVLGGGRYGTDADGFAAMRRDASQFPDRIWAIEGCNGIGRHVALRLLDAGEEVVDVPPKLSARARVFSTGRFWPAGTSWDDESQSVVFSGDFDGAAPVGSHFVGSGGVYTSDDDILRGLGAAGDVLRDCSRRRGHGTSRLPSPDASGSTRALTPYYVRSAASSW